MQNREHIADRLRIALHISLEKKFGKRMSAQRFANLFNLNAHGSSPISRETARRWMHGDSLPDYGHLAVLIQWLQLDPNEIFFPDKTGNADIKWMKDAHYGILNSTETDYLFELFGGLGEKEQNAILAVAQNMRDQAKR